jgi:hypothetical protein
MRAWVCHTAGALWFASTLAFAQQTDVDELQIEIQVLRREVKALRLRIESLEAKGGAGVRSASLAQPQANMDSPAHMQADEPVTDQVATLMRRWSKVASGMTGREVEEAIGEPAAKLTIDGRPVWYYSYAGVGRGSVMFDGGGRVSSLQAPVGGWQSLLR